MKFPSIGKALPGWQNALLAVAASILLILAFPDWDLWFLACVALVPLLFAIEREKESTARSFILGWIFGTLFFFGTCWWLTFAPITYAGFPPILAYSLMLLVAALVGIFPALFAAIVSVFLRRYRELGFLAVPFVWVFTEFLRYWLTGNNWNALGYSQAFSGIESVRLVSIGGVYLLSFFIVVCSSFLSLAIGLVGNRGKTNLRSWLSLSIFSTAISPLLGVIFLLASRVVRMGFRRGFIGRRLILPALILPLIGLTFGLIFQIYPNRSNPTLPLVGNASAYVIAVQPNVPMAGLDLARWQALRDRHVQLAETGLKPNFDPIVQRELSTLTYDGRSIRLDNQYKENFAKATKLVIFPESPMNFMYEEDRETQAFINGFAAKHNVSVLFNAAEPDASNNKYFNSAVMVSPDGKEVEQYDKIYLVPFGEAVPFPLDGILPGLVGNFSYGSEYDLFPVGDAKAGVMICFESHFGQLSREFVRNGADVLIEMTNDGYLGPTPVLRQHLANAVFRAVETNRPVLRVTNVGITTYINERGVVVDPAPSYQEDTRVWSVSKSDGSQTIYVRYGDWFAWLCSIVTIVLLGYGLLSRRNAEARTQ